MPSPTTAATSQHGPYHQCSCYNHDTEVPNYRRDVANPRTLQGYYAPKGGCPCNASSCGKTTALKGATGSAAKNAFRAAEGPHTVHTAAPASDTPFPNSRNYGGTVAQRGQTTYGSLAHSTASRAAATQAKKEERAQDRKNFLKAVLRDEMMARLDAEGRRAELEGDTGLMGTNHVDDYAASQQASGTGRPLSPASRMASRGPTVVPTVGEQYGEIMDELEFVAGQPVGSKYNIIRLHYLVEEERRLNELRRQEKLQKSEAAFAAKSQKKTSTQ